MAALELQCPDLLLEGLQLLHLVVHQSCESLALIGIKELASVWGSLGGGRDEGKGVQTVLKGTDGMHACVCVCMCMCVCCMCACTARASKVESGKQLRRGCVHA